MGKPCYQKNEVTIVRDSMNGITNTPAHMHRTNTAFGSGCPPKKKSAKTCLRKNVTTDQPMPTENTYAFDFLIVLTTMSNWSEPMKCDDRILTNDPYPSPKL